jgi:hypothetical protein
VNNSKSGNKRITKAGRRKRMVRILQGAIAIVIALGMIVTMFIVFLE